MSWGDSESDALSQASSSTHSEEVPKEERCGLRPMWGLAGGGRADIRLRVLTVAQLDISPLGYTTVRGAGCTVYAL